MTIYLSRAPKSHWSHTGHGLLGLLGNLALEGCVCMHMCNSSQ